MYTGTFRTAISNVETMLLGRLSVQWWLCWRSMHADVRPSSVEPGGGASTLIALRCQPHARRNPPFQCGPWGWCLNLIALRCQQHARCQPHARRHPPFPCGPWGGASTLIALRCQSHTRRRPTVVSIHIEFQNPGLLIQSKSGYHYCSCMFLRC